MIVNGYKIEPGADLEGADLRGADLRGADLRTANLIKAHLRGANLAGANLRGANLDEAKLENAHLEAANLHEARLTTANLAGAILTEASLESADLQGANLRGANLYKARLSNSDLRDADLTAADFRYADIEGADLEAAKVEYANFWGAYVDGSITPDGYYYNPDDEDSFRYPKANGPERIISDQKSSAAYVLAFLDKINFPFGVGRTLDVSEDLITSRLAEIEALAVRLSGLPKKATPGDTVANILDRRPEHTPEIMDAVVELLEELGGPDDR
jgi:hypothetical protein